MITKHPVIQNSPEWLELRQHKITGSNADKLLTWGSRNTISLNNLKERSNFYSKRGHILEPEAIGIYEAIHGCTVERPGLVTNDLYPNAACSPDGIDGTYLLEIKAFAKKRHGSIFTAQGIPFKIMAQLQFNMMICELLAAKLIMYNPDIENPKHAYREILVHINWSIQRNLKDKLRKE